MPSLAENEVKNPFLVFMVFVNAIPNVYWISGSDKVSYPDFLIEDIFNRVLDQSQKNHRIN